MVSAGFSSGMSTVSWPCMCGTSGRMRARSSASLRIKASTPGASSVASKLMLAVRASALNRVFKLFMPAPFADVDAWIGIVSRKGRAPIAAKET